MKTFKKFAAMLLATALLVTGMTVFAEAATGTVAFEVSKSTLYDTTGNFTVDVIYTITNAAEGLYSADFAVKYDSSVVKPSNGTDTAYDEYNKAIIASAIPESHKIMGASIEEVDGDIKAVVASIVMDDPSAPAPIELTTEGKFIVTLNFTTVEEETGAFSFDQVTDGIYFCAYDNPTVPVFPTVEAKAIAVCATPTAPEVSEVAVTAPKSGSDATISYSFNDNSADTEDGDISELAVAIDGEEVDVEIIEKTFAVADEWVGKELTVGVKAKADREIADEAESFVWSDAVVVMPADDYAPEATLELKKVTIGKEVELDYVIDAYTEEGDVSEYKWFVVEATDADSAIAAAESAEAVEGFTTANPTFEKTIGETETKGKWAVVEVTAKEEVNGETYPMGLTEPNVYYAAAEIKTAKSGGVQGGASLVTGTTETKPEVKPDEPGTDEPKPEEPGTTETEDPAGTANEAGAAAFTDVDKEAYAWAYDSIDTLAKSGVIKGMTADTFGPELSTTNAQVIALVVRIAGLTAENATTDKVDAEHWVYKEMAAAQAADILGVFGDKIDVEEATTREAAFTLLYNALKAAGVELKAVAEDIAYTDAASIDENCKEAISALTKAGIINGMGDGTLAPKAEITRAQLAKILGLANAAK